MKHETELAETKKTIGRLEALLKSALKRITELEAQINKNSKNSSKPLSTDQKNNMPVLS